ncbi:MAG: uracil-DNA glycosylase, partial [Ignavibacteria bacterium]
MSEKIYIPGIGPIGAKLFILGEAPAYHETIEGKPFVGPSGKELNRLLSDSGINRSNCWLSNVCKYEVPSNLQGQKISFAIRAKNSGINIEEQLQELQQEITAIKPNCILALGGTALWALSGKTKISSFRGSIMHGMGVKFIPTYHPAHLLHTTTGGEIKGYWNRQVMIFDFKRAHAQSQFPERNLPSRFIQICKNSAQLAEFRAKYKDKIRLSVDI